MPERVVHGGFTIADEILGIDVSAWQPKVDWSLVAKAGYRFAYVKTSEGSTYTSPTLKDHWRGAGEAGLLRGGYHFFHPLSDAKAQAARFVKLLDDLPLADLPPALDFEAYKGIAGVDADVIVNAALACLAEIERLSGVVPVLYTGPSFWRYRLSRAKRAMDLTRYPLWEASYTAEPRAMPWPPSHAGHHWTIWQRSGSGVVPGVKGRCDVNVFSGTEEQLLGLRDLERA